MIKQIQTAVQIEEELQKHVFEKEAGTKPVCDLIRDTSVVTEVMMMFHSQLIEILYIHTTRWCLSEQSRAGCCMYR